MLTETFVSALLSSPKPKSNSAVKDAGIHIHDFQPTPALKTSFKKSSTPSNCLAVSASHIFAAQAEKAVVHVYSRERGNQEAIVPFPERIHSIVLVGDANGAGVLALGTEEGRIVLWELCTGRSISTPQSHLQAVTTLAVEPTSNFLLSGSPDSNIHVWSLPALLSFSQPSSTDSIQTSPRSPRRSLSNHRAAITHLVTGHGSSVTNIAVSASQDNTCIVWDYHTGTLLRTFLLPSTPLCLALDPADRACYAGYEDGSIQLLDFYKTPSLTNTLYDPAQQATPSQAPLVDRWAPPNESLGAVHCVAVNYEGTTLITGHQSGKIVSWDVAKGRYVTELFDVSAPVTNLYMLSPTGFPHTPKAALTVHNIVKPRYETSLSHHGEAGVVPANYSFAAHFTSSLHLPRLTADEPLTPPLSGFDAALDHPWFPTAILDEGLAELASWDLASTLTPTNKTDHLNPSSSLDGAADVHDHGDEREDTSDINALKSQIADLNTLIQAQHKTQKWTWEKLLELNTWRFEREKRDMDVEMEMERNDVVAVRNGNGTVGSAGDSEGQGHGEVGEDRMDEDDDEDEDEDEDGGMDEEEEDGSGADQSTP